MLKKLLSVNWAWLKLAFVAGSAVGTVAGCAVGFGAGMLFGKMIPKGEVEVADGSLEELRN